MPKPPKPTVVIPDPESWIRSGSSTAESAAVAAPASMPEADQPQANEVEQEATSRESRTTRQKPSKRSKEKASSAPARPIRMRKATVELEPELYKQLRWHALDNDLRMQEVLYEAVTEYLQKVG